MSLGVGKSGSPAPKPMTSRPAALRALALASTARVADSLIAAIRAETRRAADSGMAPSSQPSRGRVHRGAGVPAALAAFDPPNTPDVHWRVRSHVSGRRVARANGDVLRARDGRARTRSQGSSSIGRVPVSKTGGWGFESLLPCEVRRDRP